MDMMKMADMKLPKSSKKDGNLAVAMVSGKEEYPYGLRLDLNEDQLKNLGSLFESDTDTEVMIHAKGKVLSKRSEARTGGKSDRSMEIQITSIGCAPMSGDDEGYEADREWRKSKKK